MKALSIFMLIIVIFSGCKATKFKRMTDAEVSALGTQQYFIIDSTFKLYMRQVIAKPDSNGISLPVSSLEIGDHPIIEKQYLLISDKHRKALVLNNIPSRYLSFYNSPGQRALTTLTSGENVDVWYFNQFRFGEIVSNNQIDFPFVENGLPQKWSFTFDPEKNMLLHSVAEYDTAGQIIRYVEPAYSIKMLFYSIDNFQLIFKDNSKKPKTDNIDKIASFQPDEYPLSGNQIGLINGSEGWKIIFHFDKLPGEKKNVVFPKERMYAAPGWDRNGR